MKKSFFLLAILIISLSITGCNRNYVNKNDVAYRNQNVRDVNDNDVRLGRNVNEYNQSITNGRNRNINNDRYNITQDRNNMGYDNRSKIRVADQAAKKIADLPEVDTANVIVTENNAYVAVKLSSTSRNKFTPSIEKKISQRVKSTDRDIDHVYISENPDFYNRMNTYAADIRSGKPVSGFFNQFTETIRRMFPKEK